MAQLDSNRWIVKNLADRTFASSLLIILVSSFFIERLHVTSLALIVILSGQTLLSIFLSEQFLRLNMWAVLLCAGAINITIFSAITLPFWMGLRKSRGTFCAVLILVALSLYLALLFVLFPATDGP
jgi:hypothetical protein